MEKVRKYIVYALLLPICIVAETIIIRLLDIIFRFAYENIWIEGTKVGFIVWLVFLFARKNQVKENKYREILIYENKN